jgi:hypothetical protein
VSPQQLCDLIDLVDLTNDHYAQAFDIKFQMLLNQDQKLMTPDEKIWITQMLFDTAFKKGDIEFAQKILGEMCGLPFGSSTLNATDLVGLVFQLSAKVKELQPQEK